jgi:hypothetical protein
MTAGPPVERPRADIYSAIQRALDCLQDVGEAELGAAPLIETYWRRIEALEPIAAEEHKRGRRIPPKSTDVPVKLRAAAVQLNGLARKLDRR